MLPSHPYKPLIRVILGAVALAAVSAFAPQPGPDTPRQWTFWQSDGLAWLAPEAGAVPADGSVIGWRFGVSPDGTGTDSPREVPAFDDVCGGQAAASGQKRVVLAVDFGDGEVDAYPGDTPPQSTVTCVVAPSSATSLQLLSSETTRPRVDDTGNVLAVSGYPAKNTTTGRELPVSQAAGSPPAAAPEEGGTPVLLLAGGAVAVAAGVGVFFLLRRRPS
ncbi:SCO2322 family protein [Herbidospora yilanensis]|uniref:SCO2322 family protein n=1 Tax=Herbidospora yilanensis TaxID=354426 RepID=UPI000780A352|nr:SCO2322 family protein [Herbidospora yilanensis]